MPVNEGSSEVTNKLVSIDDIVAEASFYIYLS